MYLLRSHDLYGKSSTQKSIQQGKNTEFDHNYFLIIHTELMQF